MTGSATKGRHRSFDRKAVLEKAAHLFWRHGYSPTSLAELTQAMGIHPPSLYNAFGGKEDLFLEVMRDYLEASDCWFRDAFARHGTIRAAIAGMLQDMVDFMTDPAHPPGCLLASGSVNLDPEDGRIADLMRKARRSREALLVCKLREARRRGELPAHVSPRGFAAYLYSLIQGMSAQARDGATREQLGQVARLAMECWPACPRY
jgi:TetR/AcrR family transcriptional regulator, copper-responsive repressor